ncbi:SPBc2 prophage-derived glycosyltransferase SunS [[Flavobacterium] thermophilum]|nr:SPBc2 prophage-derived glycosyltransferase SunS [[Flavobacterium] thermophilum]
MITISLCMIVKNEEDVLARCLDSVQHLVDEIVIVDTGSTDRTKEIARSYTARVIDFPWSDDFSAARNFSFSHATMDYIFWLDADDILPAEEQTKFLTLKRTLSSDIDSVTMIYSLAQDEYGKTISSVRRNRLVKRSSGFRWHGMVHEYLEVWGTILNSDITIIHQPNRCASDRNLQIYERQLAQGAEFSPRDLFYFANELFDHQQYERAIQYYEQFLQTKKGGWKIASPPAESWQTVFTHLVMKNRHCDMRSDRSNTIPLGLNAAAGWAITSFSASNIVLPPFGTI